MTQSTSFNNDSARNKSMISQSVVKSSSDDSIRLEIFSGIPECLQTSFDKVYNGPNLLYKEFSLMEQSNNYMLPNGEKMLSDTYRRLYDLSFENKLPKYPNKWIWEQPADWIEWVKSLKSKHLGALLVKGGRLFVTWGAICTTVGSVAWASGHYILTTSERKQQATNQAWQIINSAKDSAASGGRVDALQSLAKDGVSLAKLSVPKAYLVSHDEGERYKGINLQGADLRSANLTGATLNKADLSPSKSSFFLVELFFPSDSNFSRLAQANLEKASLKGANFEKADLSRADLRDTILVDARLGGADLSRADLRGANLKGADLTDVNLTGVLYDDKTFLTEHETQKFVHGKAIKIAPKSSLKSAYLRGTDLAKANLQGADLTMANLMDADLTTAILGKANLTGSLYNKKTKWPKNYNVLESAINLEPHAKLQNKDLKKQDLRWVNLQNANLTGATLKKAKLAYSNLTDANLRGTDLRETDLKDAQSTGAKYNEETQFPVAFDPVKAGMRKE
jgi:uncharacterized protein YjbI with pentapeptide repeats